MITADWFSTGLFFSIYFHQCIGIRTLKEDLYPTPILGDLMKKREVVKYLKGHGYRLLKSGKKHEHWQNGEHRVIVSHGTMVEARLFKKIKTDVRRGRSRMYSREQT